MGVTNADIIVENLREVYNYFTTIKHTVYADYVNDAINSINTNHWISVEAEMPTEYNSIFSGLKNTSYWRDTMYEKRSDDVRVVCELKDLGTQIVTHSYTVDGKWRIEGNSDEPSKKVLYWMENPTLPE